MLPDEKQAQPVRPEDVPLPATFTFVLILGITFFVLWFGLFWLLKERW